ncbi:hypothetical protein N9R43_00960 [bacterium]|nr:hypothetical protein [bacterium]
MSTTSDLLKEFNIKVERSDKRIMVRNSPNDYFKSIRKDFLKGEWHETSCDTEYLTNITGRDRDIVAFLEFVEYSQSNIHSHKRNHFGDPNQYNNWIRQKQDDCAHEDKIRREHPIAQAAWEQYQAALALVK